MVDIQNIYKICTVVEWHALLNSGQFAGSPDDLRDGFVHLSAPTQVARTAGKFFAGRTDLVLLNVLSHRLGPALRWEASSSGALYPHLYAPLPIHAVAAATPLKLGPDGHHVLPLELV